MSNVDTLRQILSNDLAAKWINLRDYALDKLEANAAIKAIMDEVDKYGYGEWVYDGTSWGPKGNVPIMTANNAPYGEASASTQSANAYKAFNGSDNDGWYSDPEVTNNHIKYKFANPVCVKKFKVILNASPSTPPSKTFVIKGSNDGTTWSDALVSFNADNLTSEPHTFEDILNNDDFYLYYGLFCNDKLYERNIYMVYVNTLQFYGRELKPLVPIMTANDKPKGTIEYSSGAWNTGSYVPKNVFDGDVSTIEYFGKGSVSNQYIGYHAVDEFLPKMAVYTIATPSASPANQTAKIQEYVDGDWTDISSNITDISTSKKASTLTATKPSNRVRFFIVSSSSKNSSWAAGFLAELQFYGMDYSEKEFASGSTRKTIYDHGVAPSGSITASSIGTSSNSMTEESNQLLFSISGSSAQAVVLSPSIDMSDYDYLWVKVGSKATSSSANFGHLRLLANTSNFTGQKGLLTFHNPLTDLNHSLDVIQINEGVYIAPCTDNASSSVTHTIALTEIYVE